MTHDHTTPISSERLDRWGLKAMPAFVEDNRENTVFRAAGGFNYRNSSVTVFDPSLENATSLLPEVLSFSEREGIEPVLRVVGPSGQFGEQLYAHGWAPFRACRVMTRRGGTGAVASSDIADCQITEWLDLQVRHKQLKGEDDHLFRKIFTNMSPSARPIVFSDSARLASALLYEEGGWTGLMNMLVDPEKRGQGIGKSFLTAILKLPTEGFWLQVFNENVAALCLYQSMGFEDAYSYEYWRRSKPIGRAVR